MQAVLHASIAWPAAGQAPPRPARRRWSVGADGARWSVVGWPWSSVTGEPGEAVARLWTPARPGLSLPRDRAGAVADGSLGEGPEDQGAAPPGPPREPDAFVDEASLIGWPGRIRPANCWRAASPR